MLENRRADHIIICATYFVCKMIARENTSFRSIIDLYKPAIGANAGGNDDNNNISNTTTTNPNETDGLKEGEESNSNNSKDYLDVELDIDLMMRQVLCKDKKFGNIIEFYNEVFIATLGDSLSNFKDYVHAFMEETNIGVLSYIDIDMFHDRSFSQIPTESSVLAKQIIACKLPIALVYKKLKTE
jgi:hypothetical protein